VDLCFVFGSEKILGQHAAHKLTYNSKAGFAGVKGDRGGSRRFIRIHTHHQKNILAQIAMLQRMTACVSHEEPHSWIGHGPVLSSNRLYSGIHGLNRTGAASVCSMAFVFSGRIHINLDCPETSYLSFEHHFLRMYLLSVLRPPKLISSIAVWKLRRAQRSNVDELPLNGGPLVHEP
jgi:hypothetical protein